MVAPKEGLPRFRLGQAPPFRPLSSALREPAIRVVDDLHAWFAAVPGENYAREHLLIPTGAWNDIYTSPPPAPGLTEIIRLTLPRPSPITLQFNTNSFNKFRFQYPLRLYAEYDKFIFPALPNQALAGRIFIEWGVGKSRNWAYCDIAPGTFVIPNASWVSVSAWCDTTPVVLETVAQVGYLSSNPSCTWTMIYVSNKAPNFSGKWVPPFARELTAYFYDSGALGHGQIWLDDAAADPIALWDLWSPVPGAAPAIPYAPVRVPVLPAWRVNWNLLAVGGAQAAISAMFEIRI